MDLETFLSKYDLTITYMYTNRLVKTLIVAGKAFKVAIRYGDGSGWVISEPDSVNAHTVTSEYSSLSKVLGEVSKSIDKVLNKDDKVYLLCKPSSEGGYSVLAVYKNYLDANNVMNVLSSSANKLFVRAANVTE